MPLLIKNASRSSLRSESRKSFTSEQVKITTVQVSIFTLKQLLRVVAEPVWYVAMLILNYVAIIWIVYGSLDARCIRNEAFKAYKINELLYTLDGVYLFDVLMVICCKFIPGFQGDEMDHVLRPTWMLGIEVVSLIPIELFQSKDSLEETRLFCMLKLTKVVRFVRIVYFYIRNRNFIDSSVTLRIIGMLSVEVLIIMLAYSIYCNASCYSGICVDPACINFEAIVTLTACLTSSGLNRFPDTLLWNVLTSVLLCLIFFCVVLLTTCDVALEFMEQHVPKVLFVDTYSNVINRIKRWNSPNFIKEMTHSYFNTVWKLRYGYNEHRFHHEDLPNSFKLEMLSDIYWDIFKHSHLLKFRSQPFLREVCTLIKQEYKLPGELLWARDQYKTKMIYVVSGTIQLLSEEDGESPVLAFTSGTCLGDSCLVTNYKSRNNVRCKGFCEIYTLDKGDFARIFKKFPEEYKIVMISIENRYNNARSLLKLCQESKAHIPDVKRKLDSYGLLWMKNTLHKHMATDNETMRRHRFQNIYLLNEVNPTDLKRVLFSANYLDTLAIAERLEIDTDTVFLKPSFPCILQPNSVIVYFWEALIICITIFTSFLVPRQAFLPNVETYWFSIVMSVVTLIYCFDIYVQFSIGLSTRVAVSTKFYNIAKAKMNTWGFWLDVCSCFPVEVLKSIVLKDLHRESTAVLYLNRLIKLWRIEALLKAWEQRFHANFLLIHICRYSFVFTYTIYFHCCYLNRLRPDLKQHEILFISIQLVTNSGIPLINPENSLIFAIANLLSNVVHLMLFAHFISANALLNLSKVIVQQYSEAMDDVLKKIPRFSKTFNQYLYMQWQDNRCEHITSRFNNLPETLDGDMLLHLAKEKVENVTLFSLLPQETFYDICSTILKYRIYSPNELIVKSGDIVPYAIMVYGGVTEVISPSGDLQELETRTYMVNFIEASLRAQSATTVICSTYCKAFYFHIAAFEHIIMKNASIWAEYNEFINSCIDLKLRCRYICENEPDIGLLIRKSSKAEVSRVVFPRNFKKDSYAEYDYYIPFDKLFPFNFVRHVLMRTVFLPDGRFLLVWESIRCGCAILTCILFFSFPFVNKYSRLGLILDFACLADMYVRMHVAYYNTKGILITHPTETAKYYITHSFVIDLLGSLPLSYFTSTDAFGYFTLNFPRLAQLYRYIKFMQALRADPTRPINKWQGLMYIPLACVIINLFGALLVTLECVQEIGALMCMEAVMIVTSNMNWFSDVYIHISGVFVAASTFLNLGMGTYEIRTKISEYMISVICILGVYFKAFVISHMLTMYSFRNKTLSQFQDAMHSLKMFLKSIKTDQHLKKAVIIACELQWKNLKSRDVHALTESVFGTLRIDMIYDYYGEDLFQNSVFTYKRRSFYRNLVLSIRDECYPKDGYVTTINDITKYTFILFRGTADVLAPDGTVLTTLVEGSIFGNLEYAEYTRIKGSIVANSNIRVLSVPSVIFHNLLHHYPKIKKQFNDLKWKYMTYIPLLKDDRKKTKMSTPSISRSAIATRIIKSSVIILNPLSKQAIAWQFLTLFYSCYVAVLLDFYQIGAMEFSYVILVMQYVSDLLYLLHLISKQFSPYLDEAGNVVNDPILIKKRNATKKYYFVLYYSSVVPIDFVVLVLIKAKPLKYYLFALFRLNRLLRLFYVIHYFKNVTHRFNANVLFARFSYIMLWMSIVIFGMASLLAFASCIIPGSFLPLLPTCEMVSKMSTKERMSLYMKYVSFTGQFLTFSGQHVYTPQHKLMLILCIIYAVVSLYIYSILYSQIYSVVRDGSRRRIRFREFGNRLKKYMLIEDTSVALIDRVIRYVELLWFRTKGTTYPTLLRDAPVYLQDAILFEAYYSLIGQHVIFENCHLDCVRQIIQKTKTEIYFYDEYIQFKGIIQGTMYFISKGTVRVVDERDSHDFVVKVLTEGESFGIMQGLYADRKHNYTFQVENSALIVSLTLSDWTHLMDFFPASKEKIYKVAESYIGPEDIP